MKTADIRVLNAYEVPVHTPVKKGITKISRQTVIARDLGHACELGVKLIRDFAGQPELTCFAFKSEVVLLKRDVLAR